MPPTLSKDSTTRMTALTPCSFDIRPSGCALRRQRAAHQQNAAHARWAVPVPVLVHLRTEKRPQAFSLHQSPAAPPAHALQPLDNVAAPPRAQALFIICMHAVHRGRSCLATVSASNPCSQKFRPAVFSQQARPRAVGTARKLSACRNNSASVRRRSGSDQSSSWERPQPGFATCHWKDRLHTRGTAGSRHYPCSQRSPAVRPCRASRRLARRGRAWLPATAREARRGFACCCRGLSGRGAPRRTAPT